jgi:hypothetical protein
VLAHDALQAGQFDDHLRDQVDFGQVSSTDGRGCLLRRQAQHLTDGMDQFLQPSHFVAHRAELFLEGERIQARQVIF